MKANRPFVHHLILSFTVFLFALTASSGLLAQPASGDPNDVWTGRLEEIVVTAQRRETNLQQTGLAVSVLSGDNLIEKGIDDLVKIQYSVPSVNIADFGSANVFNIRGIGRSKVDIEIPSGVVIYQDGVPTIAGYFQNEPYYDMASVEVLRGPQGTFFGKSASGGAVYMRTRNPELGEFGGRVELGAGSDSMYETRGALNMSNSDTFGARVAFNYYNRDSYYDVYGPYTGDPGAQDLLSLRLGMLWQPSDKLSVNFKYNYADLDFGGNVTSAGLNEDYFYIPQDAPFAYRDESSRFVLDIDYEMDNGITFSSLTGYQTLDTVNNLDINGSIVLPRYWFKSAGKIDLFSQEFNLISSEDQRLRWVTGVFYQNQKSTLLPVDEFGFTFIGGDPFLIGQLPLDYPWLGSPWTKDEDDWAVFGQVMYDLTDALELEVGARYSDYKFHQITEYVFGFGDAPPVTPFLVPEGPDRQDMSDDAVDWKVALNWTKDDDNFIYGLISFGHTWGSINIFPPFEPYGQMEVTNYETGWKSTFMEGQLLTQLSVYYEDIDGYQASFDTLLTPPNTAGQVKNALTTSTIYGLEFTGQAAVGAWTYDFSASVNESELGTFKDVLHPITGEVGDLSGAPFPYAPDWTASLGVSYTWTLSNGSTLTPRFDYGYVDDAKGELFDDPEFRLPSRGLLNINIRWAQDDSGWYAEAWGTNLTDEKYIAAIQNLGALYYAGPPLQWGVRVGKNF